MGKLKRQHKEEIKLLNNKSSNYDGLKVKANNLVYIKNISKYYTDYHGLNRKNMIHGLAIGYNKEYNGIGIIAGEDSGKILVRFINSSNRIMQLGYDKDNLIYLNNKNSF